VERAGAVIGLLSTAYLSAACHPAAAAAVEHVVVLDKMVFTPAPTNVRGGDVIVWVNKDIFKHTATDRRGRFDVDLPAGATKRMSVRWTGAIDYFCRYHPGMTGRVTVANGAR
jgi:plastocyanin